MNSKKRLFLKGIENLKTIRQSGKMGIKTSIKIFLYYVCLCFLARYQVVGRDIFFINGRTEAKRHDPTG